jgi:hypothetical protein
MTWSYCRSAKLPAASKDAVALGKLESKQAADAMDTAADYSSSNNSSSSDNAEM